jgi:hypothetical protein
MLGTGTRGCKHNQHVSHCLSGLRLNTVKQSSGAIGAELATNIKRLGSGCAITPCVKAGLLWSSSGSRCVVFAVMSLTVGQAPREESETLTGTGGAPGQPARPRHTRPRGLPNWSVSHDRPSTGTVLIVVAAGGLRWAGSAARGRPRVAAPGTRPRPGARPTGPYAGPEVLASSPSTRRTRTGMAPRFCSGMLSGISSLS